MQTHKITQRRYMVLYHRDAILIYRETPTGLEMWESGFISYGREAWITVGFRTIETAKHFWLTELNSTELLEEGVELC